MPESTDIQHARLDERMKMMLDKLEENHESHVKNRAWMSQVDRSLHDIGSRVSNVENSISKNAPSLEELVAIKHKVIGAGVAGKWLWVALGSVLTMIITGREHIFRWFAGHN